MKNIEKTKMVELPIFDEDIIKARSFAKNLGVLKNSITKGQHSIYGFLGEILVSRYLDMPLNNTYEYDIKNIGGLTLEVKTKRCTSSPKENYDCSIANFNTKQKCTYYVFVRVLADMSKGWLLGYKSKEDYFKNSIFMKRGTVDPSNNFTVRADCHNMKISKLSDIKNLKIMLDKEV